MPRVVDPPDLDGRTAFITGTTRGIGKAIALALAEAGCDIVSTGKTVEEDGDLPGSIHQTAAECEDRGAEAHAVQLDVRDPTAVETAARETMEVFGGADIVINNASAIQLATVADLPADRFDLLTEVNVRGTYLVSRAFLPQLQDTGGWLFSNAPPVTVDRAPGKAAYAWSKLGMSFVTLSLAEELGAAGDEDDSPVGCNCFWPVTAIDTRATRYFGLGTEDDWRHPDVVADTVLALLKRNPESFSGHALYDEAVLRDEGISDFEPYNLTPGDPPPRSARLFDSEFERPA